jgi:hypothetical protein
MSNAHKGSRLILKDQVIATSFNSFYADYNIDASSISYGNILEPNSGTIHTMRPIEGKFGGGVAIEQETTNLMGARVDLKKNTTIGPYHLNNISNAYFNSYSGYDDFYGGTSAVLWDNPSGGNIRFGYHTDSGSGNGIDNGGTYTMSFYAKLEPDLVRPSIFNVDIVDRGNVAIKDILTNQWQRFSFTVLHDNSASYHFADFELQGKVLMCSTQIERKPFPSSYIGGSRNSGKLWYPKEVLNPNKFTLSMWFKIPYMHRENTGNTGIQGSWYHPIVEYAPSINSGGWKGMGMVAGPQPSSWNRRPVVYSNGSYNQNGIAIEDNTWYHAVVIYDGTTIKGYINGSLQCSVNASPYYDSNSVLMVGGGYMGKPSIIVDELYVDNGIAHTEEEILSWYISEKPFYNPYDYRSFS